MKKRFDFPQACAAMLQSLGAQPAEYSYPWQLQSVAGVLRLHPYDNWLACRFEDVAAAKALVGHGQLNPYSGKWNWHFDQPNAEDVAFLRTQLERILPTDTT